MRTVATIGVYGWTLERFLNALHDADVGLLVDVRQRRGVRGREYSWANARRLERALADAGIGYSHHKELAPTTELRHVQYREDDRAGVGKRSRAELAPEYRERYLHEILEQSTSMRCSKSCRAAGPQGSSASSATPRRVTARSSPSG